MDAASLLATLHTTAAEAGGTSGVPAAELARRLSRLGEEQRGVVTDLVRPASAETKLSLKTSRHVPRARRGVLSGGAR